MSSNIKNIPQFEREVTEEEVPLINQNLLFLRLQVAQLKTQVEEEKKKKLIKKQHAEVVKLQLELLQLRFQSGHTYNAPQCNLQI